MITRRFLERDGERLLLRLMVHEAAALDILTDPATLAAARGVLADAPDRGPTEAHLGTFGPFAVTISTTDGREVAIAVDGPDHGPAFRGHQAVVFYVSLADALAALTDEIPARAG